MEGFQIVRNVRNYVERMLVGLLRKLQLFILLIGYEDEMPKDTLERIEWSRLHEYQFLVLDDKQIMTKALIILLNLLNQVNYIYFESILIFASLLSLSAYRCSIFLKNINKSEDLRLSRDIKLMKNAIHPDYYFIYFSPLSVVATVYCLLPPRPNHFCYFLICLCQLFFSRTMYHIIRQKEKETVGILSAVVHRRSL